MVGPERGGTSSAGDSGRGREPRRWQEPWLHHTVSHLMPPSCS